jgi:hypothetical protein
MQFFVNTARIFTRRRAGKLSAKAHIAAPKQRSRRTPCERKIRAIIRTQK